MKKYEAIIVFNMKGTESSVADLTKAISTEMSNLGATVTGTEDAGRREFVYESNHVNAGQYIVVSFEADPASVRPIREQLRLNPVVHAQYYKAL